MISRTFRISTISTISRISRISRIQALGTGQRAQGTEQRVPDTGHHTPGTEQRTTGTGQRAPGTAQHHHCRSPPHRHLSTHSIRVSKTMDAPVGPDPQELPLWLHFVKLDAPVGPDPQELPLWLHFFKHPRFAGGPPPHWLPIPTRLICIRTLEQRWRWLGGEGGWWWPILHDAWADCEWRQFQ